MEELKLQRGSSRGVQLAGAEVSKDSTQGNTEQIHQLCKELKTDCASKTTSHEQLLQGIQVRVSTWESPSTKTWSTLLRWSKCSQLQWRHENGGGKGWGNQNDRVKDKHALTNVQDSSSSDIALCFTSSNGIFPLSTARCVQMHQPSPAPP